MRFLFASQDVVCDEFGQIEPLGNLACGEGILVAIPESPAASIGTVVADTEALKAQVLIPDCGFELLQIKRRSGAVDAGAASLRLDAESPRADSQPGQGNRSLFIPIGCIHAPSDWYPIKGVIGYQISGKNQAKISCALACVHLAGVP
jgi:hypothetical protein